MARGRRLAAFCGRSGPVHDERAAPRGTLAMMLGFPRLPDMWRVLKEADLQKVRREAERPFQLLLVAEDPADAERLGRLLSSPEDARHPWLLTADPEAARRAAGSGPLDLAVVVTPSVGPSPTLGFAADVLGREGIP